MQEFGSFEPAENTIRIIAMCELVTTVLCLDVATAFPPRQSFCLYVPQLSAYFRDIFERDFNESIAKGLREFVLSYNSWPHKCYRVDSIPTIGGDSEAPVGGREVH